MTRLDVPRLRLYNQGIGGARFGAPAEVVDWLVAVQAQDYAGAKWSVGLRMNRATDKDLDRAFADGAILRTHALRPTWHFVTPADIRWLLALTAPRVHRVNAAWYRRLQLDDAVLRRTRTVLADALRDGNHLTRSELGEALQQAGIEASDRQRLAYIMMAAELDGLVCSGPRRGKQFTYALLGERAPGAQTLRREEALAELARRYFASRGPATVQDLAKWSGLTVADASRGLEEIKGQLQGETVEGRAYWYSPSTPPVSAVAPAAHLLSVYDEYFSGYQDRSAIQDPGTAARLAALGNDLSYITLIDGQIAGTWKRTLRKDAVIVEINHFRRLTEGEDRAVALAARRYADFFELPVVLAQQGPQQDAGSDG